MGYSGVPRPTHWTDKKIHSAYLLALLGASEQQMADVMEVPLSTIHYWKKNHIAFSQALNDGRLGATTKVVEAFYKICVGYDYEEEEIRTVKGEPVVMKVTRHRPADPWACARFLELKARSYNWSVTQNVQINNVNTNINIDYANLSTQQLQVLKEISQKQLPLDAGTI